MGEVIPLRAVPNEPQPLPPYDVENESAPMDETWRCDLCGERQPRWFGEVPSICRNCGQKPGRTRL